MEKYIPIQCEVHDLYEIACMHRTTAEVVWRDEQDAQQTALLRYRDIKIREGQEYLIADNDQGEQLEIRLDRIESLPPR